MEEKSTVFLNEFEQARAYWEENLSGELSEVQLPFDFIKAQGYKKGSLEFTIDRKLSDKLCGICKGKDIDLYIILTAALNILIYKYTNQNDILVGMPLCTGSREIYSYNKFIVQRSTVEGQMSIEEYLLKVTLLIKECYKHQQYPMEKLTETLKIKDNMSLFKVISIFQNIHSPDDTDEIMSSVGNEIAFYFSKSGDCLKTCIKYNTNRFREESIYKLHACYLNILEQLLANRDMPIAEVELITPGERKKITEIFNNTHVEYLQNMTLHKMFEQQVQLTPNNIAVSFAAEQDGASVFTELTYRELNEKSNQLASVLRKKGIKQDTIVAIMPRRSLEMVVGILAILKAGGAYLPIDPDYPQNRINLILEDSGTDILLTHNGFEKKVLFEGEIIDIDDKTLYNGDKSNLDDISSPKGLAYVIYTSGSTGKPKGVLVEHRNVVNFTSWRIGKYGYNIEDKSLQMMSVAFDGFGSIFYSSLLSGGTLVVVAEKNRMDFGFIRNVLMDRQITNMCLVPSMYYAILEGAKSEHLEAIRFVVLAGEKADEGLIDLSNSINPGIVLANEYGPTENTIASTSYTGMTRDKTSVIGKPISNHRVYIVNRDLNLMPIGVPGELCVTGAGVTRGYLIRPELTAEKFIEIPSIPGDESVFYRTGDLARWLDDGNIEFIDRVDHQVKVRGFRIELGEIENTLLSYEPVKQCIVVVDEDKEGSKYICAYIVSDEELTAVKLRDYLSSMLPDYMIPSQFIKLDRIPLMQNGKVDRNALVHCTCNISTGVEYSAPINDNEKKLIEIWQEVLDIQEIGVNDRFFDIGGDSMKAVRISELCIKQGMKISATDIFIYRTVAKIVQNAGCDGKVNGMDGYDGDYNNTQNPDELYANDKNGEIKLKIKPQREITTYLHRSLPLCAILADENTFPWFYQHYIEIFSVTYQNGFSRLEFLEPKNNFEDVFHEVYLKYEDVSDILGFIQNKIDEGTYVSIYIDEYCLPQKGSYRKNHFVHPSLVYGYNNISKKLMAIGFDSEMIFKEITFDYDDFSKAYEAAKIHYKLSAPWAETEAVQLLIPKERESDYEFDVNRILEEIHNYLNSSGVNKGRIDKLIPPEEMQTCADFKYGLEVYDVIVHSLEKLGSDIIQGLDVQNIIEQCREKMVADIMPSLDYRSMHLLYEHKKCLYDRLRFIMGKYYTSNHLSLLAGEYLKLTEKLNTARLIFFELESMFNAGLDPTKINFEEMMGSFQQMIEIVKSVGNEEAQLLRQIYEEIKTNFIGR